MQFSLWTCIYGILVFLSWKIGSTIYAYIRMRRKCLKLPQKKSHWLFGHLKELKGAKAYMDYALDMAKTESKVYCLWIGPTPVVGVRHPDTFRQLIGQEHRKARGRIDGYRLLQEWMGEGLLMSEGRKWERSRKLLTPAFHFSILSGYVDVMNRASDTFQEKVLDQMSESDSMDIYPLACRATLDTMMKCSLSFDGCMQSTENDDYVQAVQRMSTLLWNRMLNPFIPAWLYKLTPEGREWSRLIKLLQTFTGNIIESRRQLLKEHPLEVGQSDRKRRLDFLDILLTATDDQGRGLDRQEIQDEVDTFTFEGHDTTGSALGWAIYALGQNPEIQGKVYKEVITVLEDRTHVKLEDIRSFTYLSQYIKEVMRVYSPVPMIARRSAKTLVLDGFEIPPGIRIDINIHATHHNPAVWDKPEEFNPDRYGAVNKDENDTFGFIPFSAGSRNCIGQVFALNELKICLAKFVKRFEVFPDPGHKPEMVPDIVTRSTTGLKVIIKKRC
ncbi:cytochrome P450 4F4-like isoform X2 [Mya arenaria]|uniref:cytochrome P450 4F4-like isoform X2 n=1 Tax=Mya arenaria TaxID=6604 RepID=UPI0022E3F227|nr:cytochrome P450 4F4-like isoform X2 [Mya arenaria]